MIKFSRYYFMFLFLITLISLAIVLLDAPDVQAAPRGQSAEEQIRWTLEEANQLLGGGFEWVSTDPDSNTIASYYMSRPPPPGQEYDEFTDLALFLDEVLWIRIVVESPCRLYPDLKLWTFHEMEGCYDSGSESGLITSAFWLPQENIGTNGYRVVLSTFSIGEPQGTQGAVVLAEALHQAAINNGLYGSLDEDYLPANPPDTYSDPPEEFITDVPEDFYSTPDAENPSDLPLGIILGSLGVPLTGAVIGAVLSAILSGGITTASGAAAGVAPVQTQPPQIGSEAGEGLVWSERPWDEAGPGYVPKEEYLRTKDFLDKGYKWKDGGWQTPEQIEQIADWDRNNRKAVDQEDANWRAKQDAERQALEENKEVLEKKKIDLQNAENFDLLKDDFNAINQNLEQENIYVVNPYQGDPTVMGYGLNTLKNIVWDKTGGQWTGSQGLTCEGYVKKTSEKVLESVTNRFPGAEVQNVIFEEKSTVKADKTAVEWLDSFIDDNHSLIKIILPDGSEWAVDFHQNNAGNSPLLRPWSEAIRDWKNNYMGDEFRQYTRSKILAKPKSRT